MTVIRRTASPLFILLIRCNAYCAPKHEWNPGLTEECNYPFIGWWVCVAIQREPVTYDYPTQNSSQVILPEPTSYNTTVLPTNLPTFTPSPTQSGLAPSCQAYYQAEKNDNCTTIIEQYYYLTEKLLHDWNPALQDDCSGLREQFYYCAAAFPLGQAPIPPTVTAAPSPIANGTTKECTRWYRTGEFDTCLSLALRFGTFAAKDFIAWNPSVGKDHDRIMPDTWYCVTTKDTSTTRTEPFPTALRHHCTRASLISSTCTSFRPVERDEICEYIASSNEIFLNLSSSGTPTW
ncbi:hypothetical protein BDV06DRAFT_39510 [Aspergillus oleicola]